VDCAAACCRCRGSAACCRGGGTSTTPRGLAAICRSLTRPSAQKILHLLQPSSRAAGCCQGDGIFLPNAHSVGRFRTSPWHILRETITQNSYDSTKARRGDHFARPPASGPQARTDQGKNSRHQLNLSSRKQSLAASPGLRIQTSDTCIWTDRLRSKRSSDEPRGQMPTGFPMDGAVA